MTGGPSALRPSAFVFVADLDAPDLVEADRHHLSRVLRLRAGEVVVAADGAGSWRRCVIDARGTRDLHLETAGDVEHEPLAVPAITIGFALTKGDRPEWVVQKLTELGVDTIVPIAADRSVVRWDGDRGIRHHERLVAVAREAAMQSRRPSLPTVMRCLSLTEAVRGSAGFALCEAGGMSSPDLEMPALFIGPEGGWSPAELSVTQTVVDLGPTTLRAETAAIAAGVLLCALRSATVRATDRE